MMTKLFDLNAVEIYVEQNPTPSLLNTFPDTMNLVLPSTREFVYIFWPAKSPITDYWPD